MMDLVGFGFSRRAARAIEGAAASLGVSTAALVSLAYSMDEDEITVRAIKAAHHYATKSYAEAA